MDDLLELTSRVEQTHFWFRGFRRFVGDALDDAVGDRRSLRVLDCGCGTGHNMATLLANRGRVFGFDVTPGGLALARRAALPVVQADMQAMPFRDDSFDLVTTFDVFQYVPDDAAVMRDIARVLRPGGSLVMTASALDILRGGHAGTWPEVRRYTTGRLRRIVEQAGLRVERLTYLFAVLFPMMVAVRMLRRDEGAAAGAEKDWEMDVPVAPVNAALTGMLYAEAALSRHLPMPCGSSVLVVARKAR